MVRFFRLGVVRRERVVLFFAEGQEISERFEAEPGGWDRVLEGDRSG